VDFLTKRPFFSLLPPRFFEKTPVPSPTMSPSVSYPHIRTRERTRPCASRTQRVCNSCLHPSPSPAIYWSSVFCRWRKFPFFAFTGEGNKGEAFTRKSLYHSFLQSYGEEVKAKNEKQRTRARWGWSGRQMHFWKRSFDSWCLSQNVGWP